MGTSKVCKTVMNRCDGGMMKKAAGGIIRTGGTDTMSNSAKGVKEVHHAVHVRDEPGLVHHVHVYHHKAKKR